MSFLSRNNQPSLPNLSSTRPEQDTVGFRLSLVDRASALAGVASQHQVAPTGSGPIEQSQGNNVKENKADQLEYPDSQTPNAHSARKPDSFKGSGLAQWPEQDSGTSMDNVGDDEFNSPENVARLVSAAQSAADSRAEQPDVQIGPLPSRISKAEQLGGYLDRAA